MALNCPMHDKCCVTALAHSELTRPWDWGEVDVSAAAMVSRTTFTDQSFPRKRNAQPSPFGSSLRQSAVKCGTCGRALSQER
eukprot:3371102-Amphidinium_carterae.1